MIQNIIFDLGGVLLNLDMPLCFKKFEALGANMAKLMHKEEGERKGDTICDGVVANGLMMLYQVGGISTNDFVDKLVEVSKPGTKVEDVIDAWNSCLLDIPQYKLDLLEKLRTQGYHIYMLSNTNDLHWKHIEKTNFPKPATEYFDGIYLSHELKMAKPDSCIYEEVLKRIGVPAEECLFIDDAQINCDAAKELGINVQKYDVGSLLNITL